MARDYYCPFPLDLPSLPSIRRLRRSHGVGAVLLYYELRILCFQAYQYGQSVELADVLDSCADWGMDEGQATDALRTLAEYRLIDAEALGCGIIGIEDVAERAAYLAQRAECGKKGGRPKKSADESKSKARPLSRA